MAQARPYVIYRQDPERRRWRERERWLYWGAPLALIPAFALLPVLALMVLRPLTSYARPLGFVLLPLMGLSAALGTARLGWCLRGKLDVISAFAWGTIMVLMVVMIYTGVIAAALLFR